MDIQRSALVGYSAEQMFALINDIEAYPEYMTGVVGAEIFSRDGDTVEARLDLSKGGFNKSFATRNKLIPPTAMTMELLEGPFKTLRGAWHFEPLNDSACKVSLALIVEFDNVLLSLAAGKMFEKLANEQVDALCDRAETIYG